MEKGKLTYRRGEIRWVNLDPSIGAEAKKTRACLIIQNDTMNQYGLLTIVMPLRPGFKQAPYAVNIKATTENGLDKDRFLDVGQIRAVDGQRVKGLLGVLEQDYWEAIETSLDIVLGFSF
ncbi:transcriptional modulator of MazE/toxin, MazF (plasmid) [Gloeothece citriformis PCC 7424]|uniref:mRNA interferase n=1 Tax=Gloeothece citriformis (strain PCC 7424) TaxID=65393 RepID=B7KMB4_GLOC7|nr:type II toxin-antitoxin system PemK/MazF family toxin [Gloeothece citriformis]ACK73936.1 transcriptional modulator of MazE/toxin, MazF [Gloeothece citriformis PCC 7424]